MVNKGKQKTSEDAVKKRSPLILVMTGVIVVFVALTVTGCSEKKETGKSFNLAGKETRPLLDPALFTGQTRLAYAAAHKYSEYMDEVFCYCYCNAPPFNHMTLLSCFADRHGAG